MPGQQNSVVTVFLTNTMDRIAAFTVHLVLTRSDIANFQTDYMTVVDTTYWDCLAQSGGFCTDSVAVDFPELHGYDMMHIASTEVSVGSFDTVGTLVRGWDMVEARSVSTGSLGLDIKLTAIAERHSGGPKQPIYPQQGGVLFRLRADIFDIPPEQTDRTVGIIIDVSYKPYFAFSTPDGNTIGWTQVQVPDTNYYMCTAVEPPPGNGCYEWTKVPWYDCPEGGCDSVRIDSVSVTVLDTAAVKLYDGQITVSSYGCGDVNSSGSITIGDVSMLIDHLFISGVAIVPLERGNVNCSTENPVKLTIGDVSVLIDRLFISQNPMCCE